MKSTFSTIFYLKRQAVILDGTVDGIRVRIRQHYQEIVERDNYVTAEVVGGCTEVLNVIL